jgi:hypothetical protein
MSLRPGDLAKWHPGLRIMRGHPRRCSALSIPVFATQAASTSSGPPGRRAVAAVPPSLKGPASLPAQVQRSCVPVGGRGGAGRGGRVHACFQLCVPRRGAT